jgi:hypothetical protein
VPLDPSGPNAPVAGVKTHAVDNGSTRLSVEDPDKVAGWPVATFSPRQNPSLAFSPNGLTLAFHALHAFAVNSPSPQFRVISEDAIINGLHCVELENANAKGKVSEICLVDPARDDVVVAYAFLVQMKTLPLEKPRREPYRTIEIEYQRDRVYGWVPARFTVREQWPPLSEGTVTKYTINEPFPKDTFSLSVPTGTIVFDERTNERYRAASDRRKIDVVKFDSKPSLRIAEALEVRSDFRIERQTLKDALEFIGVRYQIPIVVHKADFEAVGIKPAVEVGPLASGMSVVELLKRILAKCPKPVGFRIEDEVLKVSPKFSEQGALRVRPAPAPQVPEFPKASKIREELEMPVDFDIQPQSLKDALEFIQARYGIRIESDPLMDSLVEVHGNFPGVRLRSLLSILLEQSPGKPLGFKIEGDVLKIYPVAQ